MSKVEKKVDNGFINQHKYFLIFIIIVTLFMSVGYASISDRTLFIGGTASVSIKDDVYIDTATIDSNSSADLINSSIGNLFMTTLKSKVVLNQVSNSTLTMNITINNNSSNNVYFDNVVYDNQFYDNSNIDYTLSGLSHGQMVPANDDVTFTITFKYSSAYLATNPSTFDNELNSYLNFKFITGYTITYIGFGNTSSLDSYILENDSVTETFNSTTGIPHNVSVTGCTSSYSSPTLTLSNPTSNVVVNRLFTVTYSGFTGVTSSLISEIGSSGATIIFNATTTVPTGVTVTGATGSYNSPNLTITNVTGNVTVTATYSSITGGTGTPDDPYINTDTTYDPDDIDEGTTVYVNVPGEPKVTGEDDGNGNITITSFEYTDSSDTNPVSVTDPIETGVIILDGSAFTIHIKFKTDFAEEDSNNNQINKNKFVVSAFEYNDSKYNGFSLGALNVTYLRMATFKDRTRSGTTNLLTPNAYSSVPSSALSSGVHEFDVTLVYNPTGYQGTYGQLNMTSYIDGVKQSDKFIRNTASTTNLPTTLHAAMVTIGGNGIDNYDDMGNMEVIEFSVIKQ